MEGTKRRRPARRRAARQVNRLYHFITEVQLRAYRLERDGVLCTGAARMLREAIDRMTAPVSREG